LHLHNLRDDYTTARIDRGDDIKVVSEELGHESITTTKGYDRETYERKRKAALDAENELHFPEPPVAGQHSSASPAGAN
jgi:site-specific recombinase XerD